MLTSVLSDSDATAAVRRPVFEVGFGAGGDVSGGLNASMGLGGAAEDTWLRSIVSISVESVAGPSVDKAELVLSSDGQAPKPALEDTGSIALGYEDSAAEQVFSGSVGRVRYGLDGTTRIVIENGGFSLSRLRINQAYEQQSVGDIVKDLAALAGVETEQIENGIDLPYYVVDDGRNLYQHIAALAEKCAYSVFFTAEGKLFFGAARDAQPLQGFNYAQDILTLELNESAPVVEAVTAIGEGAAGSQGKDAWSWLVKDPASITAQQGSGDSERMVQDASLRSNAAVTSAAKGCLQTSGLRLVSGRMHVPGAPAVVVGGSIEISDAPQEALNGKFMVRRVRHHYDKRGGFTSWIDFNKMTDGGLGGLL